MNLDASNIKYASTRQAQIAKLYPTIIREFSMRLLVRRNSLQSGPTKETERF
jgi:hypothetical protein